MSYESPLKYFRDQYKEPDKYKESHPNWRDPDLDIENDNETVEVSDVKKEKETLGTAGQKFKETIDLVKTAGIKDEFKTDEAEQKIIENRREMILKYLKLVVDDARNYLSQVNYLQLQQAASYDTVAQYQAAIGLSDGLRRTYHNKLISDLKIAMRLININFNIDFPEEFRLEGEIKMADRKGMTEEQLKNKLSERNYIKFPYPAGVFIDFSNAPKDSQGEREYIAHWASKLYTDLSAIDTEIGK
jgi:hypothetical protein